MDEPIICPNCQSDLTYESQGRMYCTQCLHEWEPAAEPLSEPNEVQPTVKVLDAHGTELKYGDTVMTTKDFTIKGAAKALKAGTKIKNIHLIDGDHNISCKIDGIGVMFLKSEFVKKV